MIIKVKNIHCETIVGAYEAEKKYKQPLVVSLEIEYDDGKSSTTDNLEDTLNYHLIVAEIKEHIESSDFNLVEKAVEDDASLEGEAESLGDVVLSVSEDRVVSSLFEDIVLLLSLDETSSLLTVVTSMLEENA